MSIKQVITQNIATFNDVLRKCKASPLFTQQEAEDVARAVYEYSRECEIGTTIFPPEGSRMCKRLPTYSCGGVDGPFHPECQNQPIITYDKSKAITGIK